MKYFNRFLIGTLFLIGTFVSCDENDDVTAAQPAASGNSITANFAFINALADGGALNLNANGVLVFSANLGAGQTGYTQVPIQTGFAANGTTAVANTAIRALAPSGSIGGILGLNPIVFRATSTSVNNLVASSNANYTVVAMDSLSRPIPQRLFSLNTVTGALAANTTWYNRSNGTQISNDDYLKLSVGDRNRCVSLGTIPAGVTDPGGPRFLLLTDSYLTFPANNTTQSQIRFINAIPNSYNLPTETRVSARLRPTAGVNISLGSNVEYTLGVAGGHSPSVGSRSTTVSFVLQTTVPGGTPTDYVLELSTNGFTGATPVVFSLPAQTFAAGKIYTVVARGVVGKTGSSAISAIVVQHN
jgi:hypothetical protein